MRHYVLGNGPSVTPELVQSLHDGPVWGVNRIWKLWERVRPDLLWRPDFYVRCEMPRYVENDVTEDLWHMAPAGSHWLLQEGFRGAVTGKIMARMAPSTVTEFFTTCDGTQQHDWHMGRGPIDLLPSICGYGTVVNVAVQLAVLQGATEIALLGCDLGGSHFYDGDVFQASPLARRAHEIAARCSPIPIYDAGGALTMYPRVLYNNR